MTNQDALNGHNNNKRDHYLLQTLGLDHDPFAFSAAELELQVKSADPPFLSYFVDLPANASEESLLDNLKRPGHAVIYGAAGAGKTTLRYALEAHSRAMVNRILIVSQPTGKGKPGKTTSIPSLSAFLEALAVDLFVQTLEQFENLPALPDADLIQELGQFWLRFIPNFRRTVFRQIQEAQPTNAPSSISTWWRTWKRVVVQYTPWTEERRQFVEAALTAKIEKETAVPNLQAIKQGSELAYRLGYEHIYYLIDVADTSQLDIPRLLDQLRETGEWETAVSPALTISLKTFLPERLQEPLQRQNQFPAALISPSFSAIISWKDPQLFKALIANRFRSAYAGSWIRGFEVLASQEIAAKLPDYLVEAADHSPRRLLQLIHLLINIHAAHAPADPLITAEEWQETRAIWSDRFPHPSSLIVHNDYPEGTEHDQWYTTQHPRHPSAV